MKKLISLIFYLFFFTFCVGSTVRAADFGVAFNNEYTFSSTGNSTVKKTFTLTNLTTNNYPTEYYLELPNDAVNVVAADEQGQTDSEVIEENGQKLVKMVFNQESLGFGNDITVVLSYDTMSLAKNEEGRWRIAIPGHISGEIVDNYTITITFPNDWGEPKRMIPPPDKPYEWTLTERSETPLSIDFETVKTPTPTTPLTSSAFPIAVGVSTGVIIVYLLFEILRRV